MHLHAHMKECILDFGPISAFWAFPFEIYNGILESSSKNWVKPEEQIMKKFIGFQELMTVKSIPEFAELASICVHEDSSGSLQHMKSNPFHLYSYKKHAVCNISRSNAGFLDLHEISGKYKSIFLTLIYRI